jgi:hypothetical protein
MAKEISESEFEEEERAVESAINYRFKAYPAAFNKLYELSLNFPNVYQLQFYRDGQIAFYVKNCSNNMPCTVLELDDTTNTSFEITNDERLITQINERLINTSSWAIKFKGSKDHPSLDLIFNYWGITASDFEELELALNEASVDVHEYTGGYSKNNSMVVFGVYSMLTWLDYIIPLHDNVDVGEYTKLSDKYYYGHAPPIRYYHPD